MDLDRTPLVYSTEQSRRAAERLLPGGVVLENRVEAAILAGTLTAGQTGGVIFIDVRDERFVATCKRVPARIQAGRTAWLVTEFRRFIHKPRGR